MIIHIKQQQSANDVSLADHAVDPPGIEGFPSGSSTKTPACTSYIFPLSAALIVEPYSLSFHSEVYMYVP